jgi:hypothetical protein
MQAVPDGHALPHYPQPASSSRREYLFNYNVVMLLTMVVTVVLLVVGDFSVVCRSFSSITALKLV